MECGTAVPPEVLEEGGMPGRSDDEGKPKPEAQEAPKKESEPEKPVSEVQSSMPGVEPLDSGRTTETLVFCPNCGMHMQSSPFQCNKCGMYLGDKPKNVPLSPGGVPLMNTDPIGVGGGIDSFGGGLGGISDSEIDRINGFMNGTVPIFAEEDNSAPDLFGNGISANDFAMLSQQLAGFSAANDMPSIEAIEREPKKTVQKSTDRQIDNFSMSDESVSAVPMTENTVPVVGNCSMDENPAENIDLDPYKFLNNSLDDMPEPLFSKTAPTAPVREPAPKAPTAPSRMPEFEPIFSKQTDTPAPDKPVQPEQPAERSPEPERIEFEPIFGSSKPSPNIAEKSAEQPVKQPERPPEPERIEFEPIFGSSKPSPNVAEKPAEQPVKQPERPVQPAQQRPAPPPPVEEAPFIAETAPVISEFVPPSAPAPQQSRSGSEDIPSVSAAPRQEIPRGNMFRCQHCGNTMYDTDKFCPSCGTPYKNGIANPKGKSKLPLFIGIAAALIVLAAGGFFAANILNNGNGGEDSPSTSESSVVSDTSETEESSQTEESSETSSSSTTTSSSSSTGTSSSSTGTPPSSTGAPPSSTGAPPSSTGAPSSSTGTRPSSTGAPPSSTGAPTNSTGAPSSPAGALVSSSPSSSDGSVVRPYA